MWRGSPGPLHWWPSTLREQHPLQVCTSRTHNPILSRRTAMRDGDMHPQVCLAPDQPRIHSIRWTYILIHSYSYMHTHTFMLGLLVILVEGI